MRVNAKISAVSSPDNHSSHPKCIHWHKDKYNSQSKMDITPKHGSNWRSVINYRNCHQLNRLEQNSQLFEIESPYLTEKFKSTASGFSVPYLAVVRSAHRMLKII